jgi:hypothetical protein
VHTFGFGSGIWIWDFGKEESLVVHAKCEYQRGCAEGRKETSCFTDHPAMVFIGSPILGSLPLLEKIRKFRRSFLAYTLACNVTPAKLLVFAPPLRTRTSSSLGCELT